MDPVTIAVTGAVAAVVGTAIAVLGFLLDIPSKFAAWKQLRSERRAEQTPSTAEKTPSESSPDPGELPPAETESSPAYEFRPEDFQLANLPTPHSLDLIGRESEKVLLTTEWTKRKNRNIVALIAEGGTGKSFLVSRWLAELKNEEPLPYAGARRIFTWSFYSQGSKGQITSSEGFFSDLLRCFGEDPDSYDSLAKADKALELVCKEQMILVLDGVEPLQNPPGHTDAGRFHDRVMGDFVNWLAGQHWPGLAIVTSRQRLAELAADEGIAVRHVDVQTLKPEDGAKLLSSLGVTGSADEMKEASKEMGGHAFGLVLLGRYLIDVTGDGDIHKRDQVKLLYARLEGAKKAEAMLQAYADWFGAESAETATLHLLGLFDRPAPKAALEKLVAEPVITGLSDAFFEADAPPLTMLLNRLEKLKLITRPDEKTVDGHPLVRGHFGAQLEKNSPEAWKQAHARLFDYFRGIPNDDQPDGEAGLMPLYQSLPHGVAADRAQEALDEVYFRRINRSSQFYGMHQLGLYSTELAALAAFFPGGWQQKPLRELRKSHQGFLLNLAGFALRALGRLQEAQGPFARVVDLDIEIENHRCAASDSNNLSELLHVRGELQDALERVNDTVNFIDRTENKIWQAVYRANRANELAMQGNLQEAKILFEEAEYRKTQEHPDLPYLISLPGFYYVALLLRTEPPSALTDLAERVQATLQIAEQNNWLLDISLDSLNLARIAARLGDETSAAKFDEAVLALKKAGTRHYYPKGYIARAGFRRAQGDFGGAWADSAEVRHIAEPSGMRLYLCDALIEEARLHHLAGDAQKARTKFEEAEAEVNEMGYHWQDSALDELRKALY